MLFGDTDLFVGDVDSFFVCFFLGRPLFRFARKTRKYRFIEFSSFTIGVVSVRSLSSAKVTEDIDFVLLAVIDDELVMLYTKDRPAFVHVSQLMLAQSQYKLFLFQYVPPRTL